MAIVFASNLSSLEEADRWKVMEDDATMNHPKEKDLSTSGEYRGVTGESTVVGWTGEASQLTSNQKMMSTRKAGMQRQYRRLSHSK